MFWDYVVKSSCGNDSVALTAWLKAYLDRMESKASVVVVYNNTGWAADGWAERVRRVAKWVRSLGFDFREIESAGMERVLTEHGYGMPPQQGKAYCSIKLKIEPTEDWVDSWDPDCNSTALIGKRRLESRYRASTPAEVTGTGPVDWRNMCSDGEPRTSAELRAARNRVLSALPEYVQLETDRRKFRKQAEETGLIVRRATDTEKLAARIMRRDLWHPLYLHTAKSRDALLPLQFPSYAQVCAAIGVPVPRGLPTPETQSAVEMHCTMRGFVVPYLERSQECEPCLPYGNKRDWASLPEHRIVHLTVIQDHIREKYPSFTYRPPKRTGGARDVADIVRWGKSPNGAFSPLQQSWCDIGWCGT